MEENKPNGRDEIFSAKVKAGKRTYFFDVKSTRGNDYYLTITESKKRFKEDGFTYEKHKIFLYKEDFNKFLEALNNTVNHVKNQLMPDVDFSQFDQIHDNHEEVHASEPAIKENNHNNSELKWD
ncbi:MAG: PUR family DNA/RNA-binding protein [Cyclobacteriaceae bacterium]|nr:PUR family DNA/RNA-binding protein [Cyclobacteriaceae bacterium]